MEDADGGTAIARTHERKATRWNSQVIHSACQRGFPCGKRYRRGTEEKEKKTDRRKRKKERTRSAKETRKRDDGRWWKWRGCTELRDIRRGVVFTAGRSVARETVSRAQIVSSFPKGRYTVHSESPDIW